MYEKSSEFNVPNTLLLLDLDDDDDYDDLCIHPRQTYTHTQPAQHSGTRWLFLSFAHARTETNTDANRIAVAHANPSIMFVLARARDANDGRAPQTVPSERNARKSDNKHTQTHVILLNKRQTPDTIEARIKACDHEHAHQFPATLIDFCAEHARDRFACIGRCEESFVVLVV